MEQTSQNSKGINIRKLFSILMLISSTISLSMIAIILYPFDPKGIRVTVSYTHLRAHETVLDLVCRLLLEKKKQRNYNLPCHLAYNTFTPRKSLHP